MGSVATRFPMLLLMIEILHHPIHMIYHNYHHNSYNSCICGHAGFEQEEKYSVQVCSLGPSLHVEGFRFPCKTIRSPVKATSTIHAPVLGMVLYAVGYFSRYIHV